MIRWRPIPALAGLVLSLGVAGTSSAATLALTPSDTRTPQGSTFSLDVVGNLDGGEIITAFDVDLVFDPDILVPLDVDFGQDLGDIGAGETIRIFSFPAPGIVDVAENSFLSDAEIRALQGSVVTLFTVMFRAGAPGRTLVEIDLSDPNVVVGANSARLSPATNPATIDVPEPEILQLAVWGALLVLSLRARG